MKSFLSLWLLCSGCLLSALVFSACSQSPEVSYHSGGMTHTFAEGKGAVPDNLPVPVYPGATPSGSVSVQGSDDEDSKFVLLSSTDPVNKIADYYQEELKKAGWTVVSTQVLPALVNLAAKKQDLEASVMLSGDGQKTSISISVNKESKVTPVPTSQTFTPDKLNPPTD